MIYNITAFENEEVKEVEFHGKCRGSTAYCQRCPNGHTARRDTTLAWAYLTSNKI